MVPHVLTGKATLEGWRGCPEAQGRRIQQCLARLMRECDGIGGVWIDWALTERYIRHMQGLTQGGGVAMGQPLVLSPWQLVLMIQLVGRRRPDGQPATSLALVEVGRGNGKSELMAAYAAARLALEPSQQEIIILASKIEQARIVRDRHRAMTRLDPDYTHLQYHSRHVRGVVRPVASAAKRLDGLSPSLAIVDEASRHRDRGLDVLISAIGKRPDAQVVCISTPEPRNLIAPYNTYRRMAIEQLERDELDPSWVVMLWGADPDDDPTDEACWIKANPGLGHMPNLTVQKIRDECRTMHGAGGDQRQEWLSQRLCLDTVTSVTMMDLAAFSATIEAYPEDSSGSDCVIGVDFAAGGHSDSIDLAAVCWASWSGDVLRTGLRYFFPAMRRLDDVGRRRKLPLREWVDAGLLEPAGDEALDFARVTACVEDISCAHRRVAMIGVDPCARQSPLIERDWLRRWPVVRVPQTTVMIAPAWGLTHELFATGRIRHPGDPVLRAAIERTHVQVMPGGLTRPMKGIGDAMSDPIMAMVMAVLLAARHRDQGSDYSASEVVC